MKNIVYIILLATVVAICSGCSRRADEPLSLPGRYELTAHNLSYSGGDLIEAARKNRTSITLGADGSCVFVSMPLLADHGQPPSVLMFFNSDGGLWKVLPDGKNVELKTAPSHDKPFVAQVGSGRVPQLLFFDPSSTDDPIMIFTKESQQETERDK